MTNKKEEPLLEIARRIFQGALSEREKREDEIDFVQNIEFFKWLLSNYLNDSEFQRGILDWIELYSQSDEFQRKFENLLKDRLEDFEAQGWILARIEKSMKPGSKNHPLNTLINKFLEAEKGFYLLLGVFSGVFSCVFILSICITFQSRQRDNNLVDTNNGFEIQSSPLYYLFLHLLAEYYYYVVLSDVFLVDRDRNTLKASTFLDGFNLNPCSKRKTDVDAFIGFEIGSYHELI